MQDTQKRAAYDRQGPSMGRRGFEGFRRAPDVPSGRIFLKRFSRRSLKILSGPIDHGPEKPEGRTCAITWRFPWKKRPSAQNKRSNSTRKSVCPLCRGSRCSPGTRPTICPTCDGQGSLRSQRGFFVVETACERCQGEGEIIPRPCPRCGGGGSLKAARPSRSILRRGPITALAFVWPARARWGEMEVLPGTSTSSFQSGSIPFSSAWEMIYTARFPSHCPRLSRGRN